MTSNTPRKEVMKMTDKKENCGCGCIPLKQKAKRATKEPKEVKKSKK